ncbi:hypothetical protein ABT352_02800 [Streptosporangium sp. NPDC000563]|uniref:hypothetical protein n=1 Tax=unclassified Streptosporangium TaxID=2632669 RepID=UPI003324CC1F
MIPTMILFGLVFGRWWRASLLAAAVFWPVVLLAGDAIGLDGSLMTAAALGVLNVSAGVAIHQSVLWIVRNTITQRPRAKNP